MALFVRFIQVGLPVNDVCWWIIVMGSALLEYYTTFRKQTYTPRDVVIKTIAWQFVAQGESPANDPSCSSVNLRYTLKGLTYITVWNYMLHILYH